jgi:hypothetical protein
MSTSLNNVRTKYLAVPRTFEVFVSRDTLVLRCTKDRGTKRGTEMGREAAQDGAITPATRGRVRRPCVGKAFLIKMMCVQYTSIEDREGKDS